MLRILTVSLLTIVAIVFLPFWIAIRGAVFLYLQAGLHWIPAMLIGLAGSTVVWVLYMRVAWSWMSGQRPSRTHLKRQFQIAGGLVLLFSLNALFNLSGRNAKNASVRAEYTQLHPFVRMSIGTLLLADPDLMVTDAQRQPEDYRSMGLTARNQSLHYPQATGYVHAADLRTRGRSWLRNGLLWIYFRALGLNTLRHGPVDHLHISLPVRGKRGI
jgi:hypothetical protein